MCFINTVRLYQNSVLEPAAGTSARWRHRDPVVSTLTGLENISHTVIWGHAAHGTFSYSYLPLRCVWRTLADRKLLPSNEEPLKDRQYEKKKKLGTSMFPFDKHTCKCPLSLPTMPLSPSSRLWGGGGWGRGREGGSRRARGVPALLNRHGQLAAAAEREGQDYRGLFAPRDLQPALQTDTDVEAVLCVRRDVLPSRVIVSAEAEAQI